ncbi:MAG: flagellar basal body rod protein FlgC [Bdellovibrionales bacterium RIFOXYD12_FULL_39_22]|nr:MAG: flagellar basal body rod protein FlgC [Bdellovibrionales bacterium RIFOXYB1_FULL_39_21]OFZ42128.1 MAG: flagellar basal body rod protein FlgC [Bdellovibrionales bacterium RIFOXYC12_FULL_39_17]OFZ50844.1 MAG: flagellar basal body rod protein FlgC [Bdellovibrionales bacterium RIFOXYC1_FULL_39_130]OFZ74501.1 MAG: flagellar basal body rod protein FlgC [Bdellovibrionales bacterium RIFOXYC2_FULL_39_8]OFZ78067.1 MAG: flagellar basal body rod protein FlgC [Bdellovibrionales bacterium RIFOXYD1_FU
MDLLTSMQISSSGLTANTKRMGAISSNIANAQTTRTDEGGPYRKKVVVYGAEPARDSFADILEGEMEESAQAVYATDVISSDRPPIPKYEPDNPDANEQGYVFYPDINVMEEMAEMIETNRSYEANVNAMNTAKGMAMKALEIGRN